MRTLLWLRRDLRRDDHPALVAAAAEGEVVPVFVLDPAVWSHVGDVRRGWLAATLRATAQRYDDRLRLLVGDPAEQLAGLARATGAQTLHVSREFTPYAVARDRRVAQTLGEVGVRGVADGSPYAVDPGTLRTGAGSPYQVFTPFSRAWLEHAIEPPVAPPSELALAEVSAADRSSDAEAWALVDAASQQCPITLPPAGEEAALARWRDFMSEALVDYDQARDLPAVAGTSQLSPHLRLGTIHPRTLLADLSGVQGEAARRMRLELGWREFYADVLHHHPHSAWADLKPALSGLQYDDPGAGFEAWCAGRTGFPIVDAGMRQLHSTGWMHNRVRMITASFLTKDLHVWWPHGARHFAQWLIDGDLASNSHGWQWVAGTGTDASPYFRVFNPITQGERFDPNGDYVRRWVPELAGLSGKTAHRPWQHGGAPGYPEPIVDHAAERRVALDRYEQARSLTHTGDEAPTD